MNKQIQFWLTFGSFITFIGIFIFILFVGAVDSIIYKKEYSLLMLPSLIYLMWQFIVNYGELTKDKDKEQI